MPFQREYNEQEEHRHYVFRNYRHALTKREHALRLAAILKLKGMPSDWADPHFRQMRDCFFDAEVAAIAKSGISAFDRQCCERLLREFSQQIYVNRCELCNRIVTSPIACACLWCGHHWYERRAEMVARSTSAIYPASQYERSA